MLEAREAGRLMDSAGASDPFARESEFNESSGGGDEVFCRGAGLAVLLRK